MQFLQLYEFFLLVICIAIQICNAYSHSHVNKYIKSANIIPSKYIFYGNIEDLQQYKTVYHTLLIRIKFKGNMNISHSSMVEVFDDEFINEDGAKFKKVTTSNSLKDANKTQLYGLTRLTCIEKDNVRVFESLPIQSGYQKNPVGLLIRHKFPRYLIPVTNSDDNIYKRDISHIVQNKIGENEYVALIISRDPSLLPQVNTKHTKCYLDILNTADQQNPKKYGQSMIITINSKTVLTGKINLIAATQSMPLDSNDNKNNNNKNNDIKKSHPTNRNIVDVLVGLTGEKALSHHRKDLMKRMKDQDDLCIELPSIPGTMKDGDFASKDKSLMKQRRNLLSKLENEPAAPAEEEINENRKFDLFVPILQQVTPMLIGLVGQQTGDVQQPAKKRILEEGVQTSSADIAHQVYIQLFQALKGHILETSLPPLTETIGENVGESVIELVKSSLLTSLPPKIKMPIAQTITENVQQAVPSMIEDQTPKHAAVLLAKSINHRLPRALAHSIVPSLIQTLTHNPLQDYYCFYCYHYKTYCQYCNYGPQQIYYAMYYTGYYSTYYTDYYVDWMYRKMNEDQEFGANADGNSGEMPEVRRL